MEDRAPGGGEVGELTGGLALGGGQATAMKKRVDAGGEAAVEPGDRGQGGERRSPDPERIAEE